MHLATLTQIQCTFLTIRHWRIWAFYNILWLLLGFKSVLSGYIWTMKESQFASTPFAPSVKIDLICSHFLDSLSTLERQAAFSLSSLLVSRKFDRSFPNFNELERIAIKLCQMLLQTSSSTPYFFFILVKRQIEQILILDLTSTEIWSLTFSRNTQSEWVRAKETGN